MVQHASLTKIHIGMGIWAIWSETSLPAKPTFDIWLSKECQRQRPIIRIRYACLMWVFSGLTSAEVHFSHRFLYEMGFIVHVRNFYLTCPRWYQVQRWEKKNRSWARPCNIGKSYPRGRNFNQAEIPTLGRDIPILHGHSWWIFILLELWLIQSRKILQLLIVLMIS